MENPQPNQKICAGRWDHWIPSGWTYWKICWFQPLLFFSHKKNRSSPSRESIRFQLEGVRRRVCFFSGFVPRFTVPNINQNNRWIIYTISMSKPPLSRVMFYKHRTQKGEFKQPANSGIVWQEMVACPNLRLAVGFWQRGRGETDVHGRQISWSNFHWPYLSGHKIFIIIAIIILITTRSTVITATFTTLARSRLLRASPEAFPGLTSDLRKKTKRTFIIHSIHVWYIYLHLPYKSTTCR